MSQNTGNLSANAEKCKKKRVKEQRLTAAGKT